MRPIIVKYADPQDFHRAVSFRRPDGLFALGRPYERQFLFQGEYKAWPGPQREWDKWSRRYVMVIGTSFPSWLDLN